jgi:nitrite reductase/ring-hydroxylating ferredoxin subunit
MPQETMPAKSQREFGQPLLRGVTVLAVFTMVLMLTLYVLPPKHLAVPQREASIWIANTVDFPVGSSRMRTWGDEIILIVRSGEHEYRALEGVSPLDGCLLEWNAESMRVTSPCGHQLYDLHGYAVAGLTTQPLGRYGTHVRDGALYVTRR